MKTNTSSTSNTPGPIPDFLVHPEDMNLEQVVTVKDFGTLTLRPIRLDDEKEMIEFHRSISDESIYMRYFEHLSLRRRISHDRLTRICTNTPDFYAVVVEKQATEFEIAAILAVGRLTKTSEPYTATFDPLMTDAAHTPKLARILLERLIKLTRAFGFHTLTGELLVADHDAVNLCRALDFSVHTVPEDALVQVKLELGS